MKSFTEYLTESKKVYEFKVKIAGTCPKDCAAQVKKALAQYQVEKCSPGKSTPIQEKHEEFPGISNVGLTVFDITTCYPVNSLQVRSAISETLGISPMHIIARTAAEQAEYALNHQHDQKSGDAVLGTDYEASNNQEKVGTKHLMSFLKDLEKTKHTGEIYSDVNDELLAKKLPSEKADNQEAAPASKSPFGAVTNPDPRKGK